METDKEYIVTIDYFNFLPENSGQQVYVYKDPERIDKDLKTLYTNLLNVFGTEEQNPFTHSFCINLPNGENKRVYAQIGNA